MARPVWDRKPNLRPGRVRDLFGPKAKLVRRGDGKYTVAGSNRSFGGPSGAPAPPEPFGGFTREQALPNELIGVEGVVGRFANRPRLNPQDYVIHQVPERFGGGFFGERRTELTGFSPEFRSDIRRFDERTAAQSERIRQANQAAVQQAQQQSEAAAQQLTGLAELQGVGFGDAQDPTALAEAQARTRGAAAATSPEVARLADLPTTIGTEGRRLEEGYRAGREEARTEAIRGQRQADAQAAFERWRTQLQANVQLRGQQSQIMAQLLSAQNAQTLEQLRQTGQLERLTAELNAQADIAEADNQRAIDVATIGAAQRDAASRRSAAVRLATADGDEDGGGLTPAQRRLRQNDFSKFVESRLFTEASVSDQGITVRERQPKTSFNVDQIIRNGINRGLTPEGSVRIMVSTAPFITNPNAFGRGGLNAVIQIRKDIRKALKKQGVREAQANRILDRAGF